MRSRLSLPTCLLMTVMLPPGVGIAQDESLDAELEGLDRAAREAIARRCLPLQLDDSAEGYRACVNNAIAARTERADAVLDTLSFDDRYAVEQVCGGDANVTPESVQACIDAQIGRLVDAPEPFLGVLDDDERRAVTSECADSPTYDGVAEYRRCLTDVLAAVESLPVPDLAALSPRERSVVAKRCTSDTRSATAYRLCLVEASGDEADIALANSVFANADRGTERPASNPSETRVVATEPESIGRADQRLAAADKDATTGSGDSRADATGGGTDEAIDGDDSDSGFDVPAPLDSAQQAGDARARLEASIAGLDKVERIVLTAAAALPIVLLFTWFLTRGSRARAARVRQAEYVPVRNHELVDRLRGVGERADDGMHLDGTAVRDASMTTPLDSTFDLPPAEIDPEQSLDATLDLTVPDRRAADSDDDPFDDALVDDFDGSLGESMKIPTQRSSGPSAFSSVIARDGSDQATTGFGQEEATAAVPLTAFGQWIESAEPSLRQQHAIEFLIYWMAYGDERYEPESRDRLLRSGAGDGDAHDLIKRRVLEQDIDAFGDTVRWLQRNTGDLQRVQIIDLLMVLLISDRAMTPVQNTLLRFLADAFGLGVDTLDERHDIAFGEPMSPLPRVDLTDWWAGVDADDLLRWDARAIAMLDPQEQYRSRLGLPMHGNIGEADIVEGFRRAARRCHPHRFDALGERERALAERQFSKFEEARDKLLGVNA